MGFIFENTKLVAVGSIAAVSSLLIGGALWYKNYIKTKIPTKWVKVGEVEELYIYPIKSFKGIKTFSLECTPLGARLNQIRDRSFVVVGKDKNFVTGREYPKMSQLQAKIADRSVRFSSPEFPEEFQLNVEEIQGEWKKIKIWDVWTEGIDCGDGIASWLSKCILNQQEGFRLLYCGRVDKGKTVDDKIIRYSKMEGVEIQKDDGGCFSDSISYHLISQASIKDLNSHLDGAQVTALNFRPNLVITGEGLIPFEEDNWKWIKIGNAVFECLAPCTRCSFTTVDPHTGTKSKEMEPITTLRRFRQNLQITKLFSAPAMGIYLGLRSGDIVRIGDEVFVPDI